MSLRHSLVQAVELGDRDYYLRAICGLTVFYLFLTVRRGGGGRGRGGRPMNAVDDVGKY